MGFIRKPHGDKNTKRSHQDEILIIDLYSNTAINVDLVVVDYNTEEGEVHITINQVVTARGLIQSNILYDDPQQLKWKKLFNPRIFYIWIKMNYYISNTYRR